MERRIGVVLAGPRSARELAEHSARALDRPLLHAGELWVASSSDSGTILGAFQRAAELTEPGTAPLFRRVSGGPEVRVAAGTLHVVLALSNPSSLSPSGHEPLDRIVNRRVRPLLRALTRTGSLAHYFGRDWVSVGRRPAAWVGFAHDGLTMRTVFEAFVAVDSPFAFGERASFAGFLGQVPASLSEIAGRPVDGARLTDAVAAAYAEASGALRVEMSVEGAREGPAADPIGKDPPWAATVNEAIGLLGAGPDQAGAFRVGGHWLVSRDAVARLESRLVGASEAALGALIDEELGAPGVALDGVRSLASVREVIARARGREPRIAR